MKTRLLFFAVLCIVLASCNTRTSKSKEEILVLQLLPEQERIRKLMKLLKMKAAHILKLA
jgi:hypothetical protein